MWFSFSLSSEKNGLTKTQSNCSRSCKQERGAEGSPAQHRPAEGAERSAEAIASKGDPQKRTAHGERKGWRVKGVWFMKSLMLKISFHMRSSIILLSTLWKGCGKGQINQSMKFHLCQCNQAQNAGFQQPTVASQLRVNQLPQKQHSVPWIPTSPHSPPPQRWVDLSAHHTVVLKKNHNSPLNRWLIALYNWDYTLIIFKFWPHGNSLHPVQIHMHSIA